MSYSGPTLVQYNDSGSQVSSLAFLSNVTEGDMLIIGGIGLSPSGGFEISDSLGNFYFPVMGSIVGDLPQSVLFYICPSSAASGACTVSGFQAQSFTGLLTAEFTPSVFQNISGLANGATSGTFAGAANQLLVGLANAVPGEGTLTGVGSGFTREAIHAATAISLEYQELNGSGSVGSEFTTAGNNLWIGTRGFSLANIPTPATGTPTMVQVTGDSSVPNPVTAGNSGLFVALAYSGTNAPMTPPLGEYFNFPNITSDTYTTVMSGVIATGLGGNQAYMSFGVWFCPVCKGGSNYIIGPGLPPDTFTFDQGFFELSPCAITASSPVASGSTSASDVVSAAIAAVSGQLLVAFAGTNHGVGGATEGGIGTPSAGFQLLASSSFSWSINSGLQVSTQPVLANGNYNADSNTWTFGGFNSVFQTGIVALGTVYTISGNAGTTGIQTAINYSGTSSGSVMTDTSGNFTITGLISGSYTISAANPFYTFSPSSRNETINTSDVTGVNFTATLLPSTRFTFIERTSTTPGATLYDVVDSGNSKLVGQLVFDPIVTQSWNFWLKDNFPNITAGSSDALEIGNFAAGLLAPSGVPIVQPSDTPSTRFKFTPVVRRSGQSPLLYLVSDGPSIAVGSMAMIVWDGTSGTNGAWTFMQTNASSEISSPNDVANITQFVENLPLISPNQISLQPTIKNSTARNCASRCVHMIQGYGIYIGTNLQTGMMYAGHVHSSKSDWTPELGFKRRIARPEKEGKVGFAWLLLHSENRAAVGLSDISEKLYKIRIAVDEDRVMQNIPKSRRVNKISPLTQVDTLTMNEENLHVRWTHRRSQSTP